MRRSVPQPGDHVMDIYETYADTLFRIAMVHLGRREDAEEATQDTFIKLMEKAPAFNDAEHQKAWLIRVITNHCKSLLGRGWRKREVNLEGAEFLTTDDPEDRVLIELVLSLPVKYRAVDQMKTNDQMRKRMENISNVRHHKQKRQRRPLYIAASVVIAASIGLAVPSLWQQWNGSTQPGTQMASNVTYDPVVIPKTELPNSNSSGPKANMLQLVVYQGHVYTQSPTSLNGEDALALRGEKLGTTTGGIHELSSQDEYKELASNIGEADIYMVDGYDKDFRIMSTTEMDGQVQETTMLCTP